MSSIDPISSEKARNLLDTLIGANPRSSQSLLYELVRYMVSSQTLYRYRSLLVDLKTLLTPIREFEIEEARHGIEMLAADGDILVNRGAIHPSPLLAIRLDRQRFKFISTLPTRRLAAIFEGDWNREETTRICRATDPEDVARRIVENRGALISPEAWAGLEHEPASDENWLAALEQRLANQPHPPQPIHRDARLDWEWFPIGSQPLYWRRGEAPHGSRIWRALGQSRYWRYALTRNGPPAVEENIPLTRDEAHRTIFAIARIKGLSIPVSIEEFTDGFCLAIPPILPYAELRYLTTLARSRNYGPSVVRWIFGNENRRQIINILETRLGLKFPIPDGLREESRETRYDHA